MIGQKHNRYTIIGNINNRVVLAYNQNVMEPWAVWWLDGEGIPYGGSYFSNRNAALQEFMARAFTGRTYAEC